MTVDIWKNGALMLLTGLITIAATYCTLTPQMHSLDTKVEKLDSKFGTKLEGISGQITDLNFGQNTIQSDVGGLNGRVSKIEGRLEAREDAQKKEK